MRPKSLVGMLFLVLAASAVASAIPSFFDVFADHTAGPPYPSTPRVQVNVAAQPPVPIEIVQMDLHAATPPTLGLSLHASDSGGGGGGGGGYGVQSFFDVFFDVSIPQPDYPADSFFDVFVECRDPGGMPGHLTRPVTVNYVPADSFFDVFFEIRLDSGDLITHRLHGQLNPAQPLAFTSVSGGGGGGGGGAIGDSFFDVFFEIDCSGPVIPQLELMTMTLTGDINVPEPPALLLLAPAALALLRRRT